MNADVRAELRAVARELLAKGNPEWRLLADSGWLGLEVPESLGGAGAGFAEVAVVLEELGRAATRTPYLGGAVLAIGALNLVAPDAERDALLGAIAEGAVVAAVALPDEAPFRLTGTRLSGAAAFVPDVTEADRLLLVAQDESGGRLLAAVRGRDPGIRVTEQPVLDATRRLGTVVADGAPVSNVWRLAGDPRTLLDRGAVAIACDSLGVAAAMLDATVAYAKVREQFGRPIGSFQAVKHACADMLVAISVSRELVAGAVQKLADGAPDAGVAASMAKSYACTAAVDVAGKAMQLHGGIGYTWESGVHRYLKRATLNRELFGSPEAHRKRLAARYL